MYFRIYQEEGGCGGVVVQIHPFISWATRTKKRKEKLQEQKNENEKLQEKKTEKKS